MAEILVDPQELKNKADTLKECAQTISDIVTDVDKEMNSMRSYWEGEAAQSSVQKFEELKKKIETSYENIEKYSKFLENAAADYEHVEITNTQE